MKRLYTVEVSYTIKVTEEDNFDAIREATFPLYGKSDIYYLSASVIHASPIPVEAKTPAPEPIEDKQEAPAEQGIATPSTIDSNPF